MKTTRYDYRKIIDGSQNDVPLLDGDTIYLSESFF
jgi:hypothetical protein